MKISQSTIDAVRVVSEQNHREYEARQAEIRAADTRAPFHAPEGLVHITAEELQLIALFRKNDDRGQKLLFRIATIHAVEYPRG